MRVLLGIFAVVALCSGCNGPAPQTQANTGVTDAKAHEAHENYE